MRHFWAVRRFIVAPAFLLLSIWLQPLCGQVKGGPASSGGGAGAGGAGAAGSGNLGGSSGSMGAPTRGAGTFGSLPNSGTRGLSNSPTMQRPMPLSGKVMFDDGTPPNRDIRIERVCGGSPHFEAYADSKGRFSLDLNYNPMASVDVDAADSEGGRGVPGMQSNSGLSGSGLSADRHSPYWNCELRASYPGYRSDEVQLGGRRALDDPNLGTIILHRLGNVKGSTISVTTAMAPKRAEKDYQKGMGLAEKGKLEESEKHLQQATNEYPKYALAWYALGTVEARQNRPSDARKSFEAAIAADSRYVSPYDQMALLAGQEGKWEEAAKFSKQVIDLNPVEFPASFWYNAVANFNLKKIDDAQKSATALVKLDTRHQFPEVEHLLAQIYLDRANYQEAATHLRTYLELVPNAKNAEVLKQDLLKLEQAKTEPKK
jgi:Tfp pilus assembly protein PilF